MSEFILRGQRILIDKPEKKEKKEGELDLIIPDNMEKDAEKEMMKEWTHLNVCAVGTDVTDVKVGDKVYVKTGALHNAEIIDLNGSIKMMVTVHDIVMIWQ
jgi:co-chaperonin GroES (HSP10)